MMKLNFSAKARHCCCSMIDERFAGPLTRLLSALVSSPHKRSCHN